MGLLDYKDYTFLAYNFIIEESRRACQGYIVYIMMWLGQGNPANTNMHLHTFNIITAENITERKYINKDQEAYNNYYLKKGVLN